MESTRKRKLQPQYQPRAYNRFKIAPSLHLTGIWLETHACLPARQGFKGGDQVDITVKEKELIIKPACAKATADKPVS